MKMNVRIIFVLVLFLMILGAFLVFSASGTYSEVKFNNLYFLFKSHLWKVIGAVAAIILVSMIPYEKYKKFSKIMLIAITGVLLLTFILAPQLKGASRWIDIGFFQFQPSELAKLILIIHLAAFIERKGELIKDFKNGYRFALVWMIILSGLVLVQPNLSTSMIIVLISITMLFAAGARIKHLSATFSAIAITAFVMMILFSHSRERVMGYANSILSGGEPNTQVLQAKIALGSGGLLGVGLGHSRQSDLFLPESYSDFIFSVLGEELGLAGAALVLFAYFIIFFVGILISKKAKDEFGQMLGFGISFNIIIGAFINAAVVMGLLPTTGITLPFISFGGTSIIIFGVSIGILINIAKQTAKYSQINPELINEQP